MESQSPEGPTRRNVVAGLAAVGVGVPLIAACASSSPTANPLVEQQKTRKTGNAAAGSATANLTPLVKAAAVPVGGGVIVPNAVVTQPAAGEYKAFSNICTHSGCAVSQVANRQIMCPCHGSLFSIADGSVEGGPAPAPLPAINITEKNGEIYAT